MAKKAKYRFTIFEGTCMRVERRCSLENAWSQKYGSGSADLGVRISNQDSLQYNVLSVRLVPYQYACAARWLLHGIS